MKIVNYTIIVKGKVQGVWFRKYTMDKATELGIKGFVQNKPEGSVYISAEATKAVLQIFIDWLYQGSPLSKVTEVVYHKNDDVCGYDTFAIRRNR